MLDNVLIHTPYPAIRVGDHLFRETTYGIVKRLRFFVERIEAERHRRQLHIKDFRILDVGCGTGINVAIPLAEAGYQVVGVDTDRASIERAKQIAGDRPNSEFINSSLEQGGFIDRFHVIICSEVLEHLEQPDSLIREMRSVLSETGLLLVTVPNGYGYFELDSALSRRFPTISARIDRLQHRLVSKFAGEELRERHAREWTPEHMKLSWSTLASSEEDHCQRFTPGSIKSTLVTEGLDVIEFKNRTFLAGVILNALVRDWDAFLEWNCSVADRLPKSICSDWMIAARPSGGTASRGRIEQ